MKTTLGDILHPFHSFQTIAERALAIRWLMQSSARYWRPRQSGGPRNMLSGHGYSIGNEKHAFTPRCHVSVPNDCVDWNQAMEATEISIMGSLCDQRDDSRRWRTECGIGLDTEIKIRTRKRQSQQPEEQAAWRRLIQLHGKDIGGPSLNDRHRNITVLIAPELCISEDGIWIRCRTSDKTELRICNRGSAYSSWDVCFLLRDKRGNNRRPPTWKPARETFVEFIDRAIRFYMSRGEK